jgi:DNA-binding NarL/FixJ family response regulator
LRRWASAAQAPATLVQRSKILLLAAEGVANSEIAELLGVSRPTVIAWRKVSPDTTRSRKAEWRR